MFFEHPTAWWEGSLEWQLICVVWSGLVSLIFLLTIQNRFSVGLRSGQLAGQLSPVITMVRTPVRSSFGSVRTGQNLCCIVLGSDLLAHNASVVSPRIYPIPIQRVYTFWVKLTLRNLLWSRWAYQGDWPSLVMACWLWSYCDTSVHTRII